MAKVKLVNGIGMNDLPKSTTHYISLDTKSYVRKPFYALWRKMLDETYEGVSDIKRYDAAKVDPEWLLLSFFKEWYEMHHVYGYVLCKELVHHGNQNYSPRDCVFIPYDLHDALFNDRTPRTQHGKGVTYNFITEKYTTTIIKEGREVVIGEYSCKEYANNAFITAKRRHILELIKIYETVLPSGVLNKLRQRVCNNDKFERYYG